MLTLSGHGVTLNNIGPGRLLTLNGHGVTLKKFDLPDCLPETAIVLP
ncbi:hypothetical protein Q2T41_11475 [Maribacter confluentis]|uniref:Uncharacterized protein n=1 Tax=Maribacter confluentis TaxID=1656093 RepID=A0ABT8RQW5_9FLAO|nr:hypothetical protein [Maribacter confluentis]MDO1513276.1 hypothetical protein [Maribacter confluentis]